MAIDQTAKRQTLARDIMNAVDLFMANLTAAKNAADEYASAGLTFVDSDFETTADMKHITAANMGTAISNVSSLVSTLASGSIDDVFNVIRP